MFIDPIFRSSRTKSSNPRARRPRVGLSLELESLENRTPLSSGMQPGLEAYATDQVAEIGLFALNRPPAVGWATLETSGFDQAFSTLSPAIGTANAPPIDNPEPTPPSLNALAEPIANAPFGAAVPAINATAGSGGIAISIPAPFPASAVREIPESASNGPAGLSIAFAYSSGAIPYFVGHIDDDGNFPPFLGTGPFIIVGPASWHVNAQLNNTETETDMSFAGTLENVEALSLWTTKTVSTGHASGHSWGLIHTEPLVQIDSSGEIPVTSGLSYLASEVGIALDPALSAAAVDDVLAWEDSVDEPVSPASIAAGGVSLNVLLGGTDVGIPAESGGVEQIAALVPLPESTLALAATLWTVSSDSPRGTPRWERPSSAPTDLAARPDAPSSWAVFVIGVDPALEQTCRQIRDGVQAGRMRKLGNESPSRRLDDRIEWQGPILPATQAGSIRPGLTHLPDDLETRTVRTQESALSDTDNGPGVVLGAMPMLSVASITTVIAGWLWKERRREKLRARSERE